MLLGGSAAAMFDSVILCLFCAAALLKVFRITFACMEALQQQVDDLKLRLYLTTELIGTIRGQLAQLERHAVRVHLRIRRAREAQLRLNRQVERHEERLNEMWNLIGNGLLQQTEGT